MGAGSPALLVVVVAAAALVGVAFGGDIVHQDDDAPKIPGCSNDFMLVRAVHPRPYSAIARVSSVSSISRGLLFCELSEFSVPFRFGGGGFGLS